MNNILAGFIFALTLCVVLSQVSADIKDIVGRDDINNVIQQKPQCGPSGCKNEVNRNITRNIINKWLDQVWTNDETTTPTPTLAPIPEPTPAPTTPQPSR